MRTMSLAILAGVLVYGLPSSASAQQLSQIEADAACPPGQVWNNESGYCERVKRGPGPVGGPGSQPAGAAANDALRRMLKIWR